VSDAKVPYITRLQLEHKQLSDALMKVLEYNDAVEFINITGYKADAIKKAEALRVGMKEAVLVALSIIGGSKPND